MKISALLSLAFACTVSASTYGQNYKLSMNKQDCSISEVLKEIEKNSEYTFFLNDNQVNVNRKTSVKANNASLEEVLEQALKNTGYQYEIVDRQIIIKSKSVSSVSHKSGKTKSDTYQKRKAIFGAKTKSDENNKGDTRNSIAFIITLLMGYTFKSNFTFSSPANNCCVFSILFS